MASGGVEHPYIPKDLHLPGFVPISISQSEVLVPYLSASVLLALVVWFISGRCQKISKTERLLMCWWAYTGLTHIILEGYFAFVPDFYKKTSYLDELWKEYSKGDSRYAGRDAAIVTVEGITSVIEGPLCLLAAYAIGTRKPYNYTLQLAISFGQLYGCLVYFITAFLLGDNFAASPFYYWAYYILANSFWIVIPSCIVMRSWKKISAAVHGEKKIKSG